MVRLLDKIFTPIHEYFVPTELYEMIKALADSQSITEVEALKQAVTVNAYFVDVIKTGNKVLILKTDGDVREVEFKKY